MCSFLLQLKQIFLYYLKTDIQGPGIQLGSTGACLASGRLWVPSLVQKKKRYPFNPSVSLVVLVALFWWAWHDTAVILFFWMDIEVCSISRVGSPGNLLEKQILGFRLLQGQLWGPIVCASASRSAEVCKAIKTDIDLASWTSFSPESVFNFGTEVFLTIPHRLLFCLWIPGSSLLPVCLLT